MANILITGTSSGLGLAATVALAKRGHRVFASMRNVAAANDLRSALEEAKASADIVELDVRDDHSVRTGIASMVTEAGTIDVVLNNAGLTVVGPLETTSDEEARHVFDTNVLGPLRVARAVLPHMRSQGAGGL